jgi:hypothetical protein
VSTHLGEGLPQLAEGGDTRLGLRPLAEGVVVETEVAAGQPRPGDGLSSQVPREPPLRERHAVEHAVGRVNVADQSAANVAPPRAKQVEGLNINRQATTLHVGVGGHEGAANDGLRESSRPHGSLGQDLRQEAVEQLHRVLHVLPAVSEDGGHVVGSPHTIADHRLHCVLVAAVSHAEPVAAHDGDQAIGNARHAVGETASLRPQVEPSRWQRPVEGEKTMGLRTRVEGHEQFGAIAAEGASAELTGSQPDLAARDHVAGHHRHHTPRHGLADAPQLELKVHHPHGTEAAAQLGMKKGHRITAMAVVDVFAAAHSWPSSRFTRW